MRTLVEKWGRSKGPFSCKCTKSLTCGFVLLLASTDTDELAWGAVPAVTCPWVCVLTDPFPPSHPRNRPSMQKRHLSLFVPGRLLSGRIRCYLPSFPISSLSKSTLPASPPQHFRYVTPAGAAIVSDLASLLHPRRMAPGSTGHLTPAFEKQAPALAMRCPRL